METNKTYIGTEESVRPTDSKSPTAKRGLGIIIAVAIAILLVIGAICFAMYLFSRNTSAAKIETVKIDTPHQPYRYGWLKVRAELSTAIKIDSDAGENIRFAPAEERTLKIIEKVNGEREFPMNMEFGDNAADFRVKGQVYSLAFRTDAEDCVGSNIVYVLYKWGEHPPNDWRLEAIRQMRGIK